MGAAVATPVLRRSAQRFFTSQETPEELEWITCLSPLHFRLFVVDLHTALSSALIHKEDGEALRAVLEDWKATAEVDADSELAERLKTPRSKKKYREWKPPDG
jgi:hypothetical protein